LYHGFDTCTTETNVQQIFITEESHNLVIQYHYIQIYHILTLSETQYLSFVGFQKYEWVN